MRISDRSSDVCSSDLWGAEARGTGARHYRPLVVGTSGTREWHAAQGLDVVPEIPCCLVQRCIALQCGALLRAERRENLRDVIGVVCDLALPPECTKVIGAHAVVAQIGSASWRGKGC